MPRSEGDVEELAPRLEQVEQLKSQGRREPGAVEHLLNLLRLPRGLAAVRGWWTTATPSLRRAAVRFSFEHSPDQATVLSAAIGSHDALLRRWAVKVLSASDNSGRVETFRRLSRDPIPMVAIAALDALDSCIEPFDLELLKDLRCASSPGLQHTARFMLKEHFGETSHREVYLSLLTSADAPSQLAAAVGLAATGQAEDHRVLLSCRLTARSKVRQQLLSAAAGLDPVGSRKAIFDDVGHELQGASKTARRLLADGVLGSDAGAISELLDSPLPHVRTNGLVLAARLSHWEALPLILLGIGDPHAAATARQLLEAWFAGHFHGNYRPPEPSEPQSQKVRAGMAACRGSLGQSATERLESALAGEYSS